MKNFWRSIILIAVSIVLLACNPNSQDKKVLRVGVISGPEAQLMQTAKEVALKKENLPIEIVEFNDYMMPNIALNDGSIDANVYQHLPYLKAAMAQHHYPFVVVGKTFVYPMGLYSKKYTKISQIPANAVVAIPNDPTNEGRALLLLQKVGLIKLNSQNCLEATVHDIIANPKKLQIKEVDAASLPRVLPDVALAAINTTFAIPAGLLPAKDALALEAGNSPYANLVVTTEKNKNDPRLQALMTVLHSKEVMAQALILFNGGVRQAW